MGASVYAEHQHADMGPDTKSRDWNREINEPIAQPSPSPSPPFIGKVGGDVLFSPHGGAGIYKNATRGYKWILMGLVFTKTPPKATNGPQTLFFKPLGHVIRPLI